MEEGKNKKALVNSARRMDRMENSTKAVSRETKIPVMAKIELVTQKDAKRGRFPCQLNSNRIIGSMNN
jgi:hypothetical protein